MVQNPPPGMQAADTVFRGSTFPNEGAAAAASAGAGCSPVTVAGVGSAATATAADAGPSLYGKGFGRAVGVKGRVSVAAGAATAALAVGLGSGSAPPAAAGRPTSAPKAGRVTSPFPPVVTPCFRAEKPDATSRAPERNPRPRLPKKGSFARSQCNREHDRADPAGKEHQEAPPPGNLGRNNSQPDATWRTPKGTNETKAAENAEGWFHEKSPLAAEFRTRMHSAMDTTTLTPLSRQGGDREVMDHFNPAMNSTRLRRSWRVNWSPNPSGIPLRPFSRALMSDFLSFSRPSSGELISSSVSVSDLMTPA